MPTIRLEPSGPTFVAEAGQTILAAALAAGVEMASSCRNGTCRVCARRVVSGTAHHLIDWPGLSHEEKAQGWILPCVAAASSDVALIQPGP